MADELQTTFNLRYTNGLLTDTVAPETIKITQTTQMIYSALVSVGFAAEEDLVIGDIAVANGCWMYMKNIDSTNFVKYGPKNGSNVMEEYGRLYAGKWAWVFLAPNKVHRWIADTAAVKVLVKLYEK